MVQSTEPLDVARKYFDVLSAKDFATVAAGLADDMVWRQPVLWHLSLWRGCRRDARRHAVCQPRDFRDLTDRSARHPRPLAAAPVHFSGTRHGETVNQGGIDLLRVEGERIAEVWLFSSDPVEADAF
ncbi:nuclear transport factor 2 family protein [Streptomyces cahuitamycinicus]|nr:nuclear transport factor 2 family protein [Streptomyces cahuitamycinicus]